MKVSPEFQARYDQWPADGRKNKARCYALWQKLINEAEDAPALVSKIDAGLAQWLASAEFERGFVHNFERFLGDSRWEETPRPAANRQPEPPAQPESEPQNDEPLMSCNCGGEPNCPLCKAIASYRAKLEARAERAHPEAPAPTPQPSQQPGNLTAADLAALAARWIDPETAAAAQLRRITHAEGAALLGDVTGRHDFTGILFPYHDPAGPPPRSYRIRRDNLESEPRAGGRRPAERYTGPPEAKQLMYFAPGFMEFMRDASMPVMLTAGEFSTLALARLARHDATVPRFLPAGLSGVWQWRGIVSSGSNGKRERGPIADLDLFDWKGRKVTIAFHADVQTNEVASAARNALTKELQSRGALVGNLEWDERIYPKARGVDDFVAVAGPAVVLRHIAAVQHRSRQITDRSNPFRVDAHQVLYVDPDSDKSAVRICGRLEVLAKSRDHDSESWGRLLSWKDDDQVEHRWLCPAELLAGDGSEIRGRLAAGGLHLSPGARAKQLLMSYLTNAQTDARITCTNTIGWHHDTFVLPRQAIGPRAAEVMLQALNTEAHLRSSGTLAQWQKHVATPAAGNSRLMLAIAAALAGPTLFLANAESGGIHFCGTTSKGKTSALVVGGSALGGGGKIGFLHSWHNTLNGLEAIAESHNDLTLFLDELGQVDAREAQETAYLLGNGEGKGRMSKSLTQRRKLRWTLLYVSAGETTLADHMASVGKTAKGGAEIRLLNIPADAGAGMGLFEDIHDAPDPATFSRRLRESALRYYGTALVPWLEYLTSHQDVGAKQLKAARQAAAKTMGVPAGAAGELYRAAERLALIGAAGELAIAAGILPWTAGTAMAAAQKCYGAWRQLRGSAAATEEQAGLRKLRLFLEREGAARFQTHKNERIANRAGFRKQGDFLILPEVWKAEICNGTIEPDALARLCKEAGLLVKHDTDRLTVSERIPALDNEKARVYVVSQRLLSMD